MMESMFLAELVVMKFARKVGSKWPPQLRHSSIEAGLPSDVSISIVESKF